jgi:diguanylate cyclase (GGDEF)-like protein
LASVNGNDPAPGSWGAQQLAEFLGGVAVEGDPRKATRRGLERVAELLEADAVCTLRDGIDPLAVGLPLGQVPEALLDTLRPGVVAAAELPGLGLCRLAREPLDPDRLQWLIVARAGAPFSAAERDLLRGMARVLGLVQEMGVRRLLLERVSEIQRQIVRRVPSREILRLIVSGAAELAGCEIALLRESEEDGSTLMQASVGLDEPGRRYLTERRGTGVSLSVRREGRLVVVEDYQHHPGANPVMRSNGVQAVMGAPVRNSDGESLAALIVASRGRGRRFSQIERETLETFAEHASMALVDVRMVADTVHRSLHDPLTGLANRSLFADRLEHALARSDRSGRPVAVLFLDIDRFKTVNDSLGHTAGDELLRAAARRLEACIRPGDTAARFGGDEFAVLVEEADETLGTGVAERILDAFARPFTVAGRQITLGASIGVAVAAHAGDDPLHNGDLAMYSAKAAGRGRVHVFAPDMRPAVGERLALEPDLAG